MENMIEVAQAEEAEFQQAVYDAAIAILSRFAWAGLEVSSLRSTPPPTWEHPPYPCRARLEYFVSPDGPLVGAQHELGGWAVEAWGRRNDSRRAKEVVFGADPSGHVSQQSGLVVDVAGSMLQAIAKELKGITWEM